MIEAEQSLIGAIILDNSLLDQIPDFFSASFFSSELNSKIYQSVVNYINKGFVADPITINNDLKSDKQFNEAGGIKYIIELVDCVISTRNIEAYALIISDSYLRGKIIMAGTNIIQDAKTIEGGKKAIEIIESAEKELYEITKGINYDGRVYEFKDALAKSIKSSQIAFQTGGQMTGITSGFKEIDKILGGLNKSDLIVIAGRPSMGKTALGLNIAFNAAKHKLDYKDKDNNGAGVVFFSLEMSGEQLATRILSNESGLPSNNIRNGKIPSDSFEKFFQISEKLNQLELFIDDTPNITMSQIRNRVRNLKRKHDIGLVVIDYLQLLNPGTNSYNSNRINEISYITRSLKMMAKEMDLPVIALSQLSRASERRDDKKPQLSDLRESGSIEQDADIVMFIYRDAYYEMFKEPPAGTPEHKKWMTKMEGIYNKAEIIIAKQRNGAVGMVNLFFDGNLTRFGNALEK